MEEYWLKLKLSSKALVPASAIAVSSSDFAFEYASVSSEYDDDMTVVWKYDCTNTGEERIVAKSF